MLFCICKINTLQAQKADRKLFENICKQIIRQNDHFLLQKKLHGITELLDPITGKEVIKYPTNANDKVLLNFKKYSQEEQIEILRQDSLPIFPLKETVYIIDTLKFLPENLTFTYNKFHFEVKTVNEVSKNRCSNVYVYAIGIREDNLIVCFSFANSNILSNYYFGLGHENLKIIKTSILKPDPATYKYE